MVLTNLWYWGGTFHVIYTALSLNMLPSLADFKQTHGISYAEIVNCLPMGS